MKNARIYIAGHTGLIGSAILEKCKKSGYADIITRSRASLDLTRQAQVERFFKQTKPEIVILAAARVGGIHANVAYPAQFIYENIAIQTNVINSAFKSRVKKLLFFGTSCTYPRACQQPMKEEYLLTGALEPTNEAYAAAKLAGIKMCQAYKKQYGVKYICVMPNNVYGPRDNFDPLDSHVIPALIRKFHEAKVKKQEEVVIWGTGNQYREFLYVEDVASACLFLLSRYDSAEIINVGTGKDVTIKELACLIKDTVGFSGKITFDASRPDGMPRKLLDVTRLNSLGWKAKIGLGQGLRLTYAWYVANLRAVNKKEKTRKP